MTFEGRTMRAAVMHGVNEPLVVEEVEIAEPEPGEVMVKLTNSSVCHSDLSALNGSWPPPVPIVLGHEGAGVVEAVGSGVTRHAVGDHVSLSWTPSCERCRFCVSGRPNLCEALAETSFSNVMRDGTTRMRTKSGEAIYTFMGTGSFAEYTVVPETGAIAIPHGADPAIAAVVSCAVATGFGAATKTVQIGPGEKAVVIGLGGVGLSVVAGCAVQSAGMVIAVDVHDDKLELAKNAGATHTVNARATDPVTAVWELTETGADYVFEAIGLKATIEQGISMLGTRGTAVIVGMPPEGVKVEIDPTALAVMETRVVGSNFGSANPPIDFPKIIGLAESGKLDLHSLITGHIKLEQINDAFTSMSKGEGLRTVIDFG